MTAFDFVNALHRILDIIYIKKCNEVLIPYTYLAYFGTVFSFRMTTLTADFFFFL